ncbi:MAG: thiol reductant ABC exporter subunit CydD [Chloroflexi bacterium]|nr:thiol reductant ABC exporter subunit CydD [Chloroflexota bacterium]
MNLDRRLLALLRGPRTAFFVTVALGVLGGLLIVAQAALVAWMVNAVFLQKAGLAEIRWAVLAFVVVLGLRAAAAWGAEVSAFRVAADVKRTLRERLLTHLALLGPVYTHGERTGELTNTLTEGLEELETYFRRYLPQVVLAAVVPLLVLVLVFPRDWISGLIMLLTAPLIPLFMNLIGSIAESLTKKQWAQLERMSAFLLDALQGLTALKILGRSREYIRRVETVSDRFRETTLEVLRIAFLSALVLEWVGTLSTAVVSVGIGLRLLYGKLTFEQAFFVLLLTPEFYFPLRQLGARFHAGMGGVAAAERIFAVLDTPPQIPPESVSAAAAKPLLPQEIFPLRLESVTFTYPDGSVPALQDVSLTIEEGMQLALVGPSGAGKTTLAYLLLRFIVPQSGEIWVGERRLAEIPAAVWRQSVAWVPQQPYLFNTTVEENIRLARPDASFDDIVQAAKIARADEFIRTLPEGYQTVVGEQGARLSGGQAQRIALARALLKDAPFLILDEPTASLDPEHEAAIQEGLQALLARRTALIIAHRLNTVTQADRIAVLENGRVVQWGAPDELAAQEGLFRRLLQARGAVS